MYDVAIRALYIMEYLICMRGILQMDFSVRKGRIVLGGIVLAVGLLIDGSVSFGFHAPGIWLIVHMVSFSLLFQGNVGTTVLKFLFVMFNMGLIVEPFTVVFDIICRSLAVDSKGVGEMLLSECVQILLLFMVAWACAGKTELQRTIRRIPLPYYFIGFLLGFCARGISEWGNYVVVQELSTTARNVYDIISLVLTELMRLFGIALAVLNELRLQYQRENTLKDQYVKLTQEYGASIIQYGDSLRKMRHDMKAHLSAVDYYLQQGNVQRARNYLNGEKEVVNGIASPAFDVGNELVSALLTAEKKKMGEDIALRCEGMFPVEGKKISDYDLCTIFSNLLSNAKEACEKLKGKKRKIYLWIGKKNGKTLILVENPIEWDIDVKKIVRGSTKKEKKNHGYGLLNVKETVERNGGTFEIRVQDEKFSVYIFF